MPTTRLLVHNGHQARVVDLTAPRNASWNALVGAAPRGLLPPNVAVDGTPIAAVDTPPEHLPNGGELHPAVAHERDAQSRVPLLQVVVVSGPNQGKSLPLHAADEVWGRGHSLLGSDTSVSRHHVRVTCRHGHVQVVDLDSVNGTLLGDCMLRPHQPTTWQLGQLMTVGESTLVLRANASDSTAPSRWCSEPSAQVFNWPSAPAVSGHSRMRWLTVVAPIPLALVLALWLKSPVFLLMMVFSPLMMLLTTWDSRRHGRRQDALSQHDYDTAVAQVVSETEAALATERAWLRQRFPDPAQELAQAPPPVRVGGDPSNGTDLPRLALRLGHGTMPSRHSVRVASGCQHTPQLDDVPAVLELNAHAPTLVQCSPTQADDVIRLIVARSLAHCLDSNLTLAVASAVDLGPWVAVHPRCELAPALRSEILEQWSPTDHALHDARGQRILIVDDRDPLAHEAISRQQHATAPGHATVYVVVISSGKSTVPPAASVCAGHRASAVVCGSESFPFTLDVPQAQWFADLTRIRVRQVNGSSQATTRIPAWIGLPVPHAMASAWKRPTTNVAIGHRHAGELHLDLAAHGPHALVAGTTGSGKSEFLVAWLTQLFAHHSPSEFSALLIDYKGGATFSALAPAPHVVGVITDLDEGLAARALRALNAEIKRRERILSQAGYASFNHAREAGFTAFGRFAVVIDEFRVLAEQIPDFVAGVVRLAAIGRSLGIHLILATQRPGGVVTADIRANIDIRVCLRVRETADSQDVIGTSDAARISRRTPGRAFIAFGGEAPVEVQTMYAGAPPAREDEISWRLVSGEPLLTMSQQSAHAHASAPTALDAPRDAVNEVVTTARALAVQYAAPHRPLLPPLADVLTVADLTDEGNESTIELGALSNTHPAHAVRYVKEACVPETFAVADLPDVQAQPLVTVENLTTLGISGAPRSGRTSALARLGAIGAFLGWSVHVVARANSPLAAVATDHAAVVASDDPHDVAQLLQWLSERCEPDDVSAAPSEPASDVLVLIDDWEDLNTTLLKINRGMGVEDMQDLTRRASSCGVRFVFAGGRTVLGSRLTPLLESRIVLRHYDPTEYSLFGLRTAQVPSHMPAGRALVLPAAHEIQILEPAPGTAPA